MRWSGGDARHSIEKVSERRCCSKKDLAVAERGVARLEILALSGAGIEGLVALETWRSGGEIANLK
jgi:hypothetical protein